MVLARAQQFLARRKPVDDDRLLRLFWNRAELKREFAKLQRERERLGDQLRQQEGSVLRGQQRLEQLEGLLADPERAANAAVFFQLRGIWAYGRRRLARLARDLTTRQQEREGQREAARFEKHRQAALAAIGQRLVPLEERRAMLRNELVAVRAQLFEQTGFWHYFTRRRLQTEQDALVAAQDSVNEQIERYERARQDKIREKASLPDDLGVEAKRLVNLSVIALSQELFLVFSEHDVVMQARDASLRQVNEASYGSLQACRDLSQRIESVLRKVEAMDELSSRVHRRAEALRETVTYSHDTDTVPVNVLADEYWDPYSVLLS